MLDFLRWAAVASLAFAVTGCSAAAPPDTGDTDSGLTRGDASPVSTLPDASPSDAGTNDGSASDGSAACPCYGGNGDYCQSAAATYAAANKCTIAGTSKDLLSCSNGSWSVKSACTNGCTSADAGPTDRCTPSSCPNGLSLTNFIKKFTGVCTGYPGWSPSNQCTDLALQWVQNICLPVDFKGNAIDWATETVPGFTWVANGPGLVPSPGDVVIFGGSSCDAVTSQFGHVDVAVSADAKSCTWQTFDQNWQTNPNGVCYPPQLVNRNWCTNCDNVVGWQHLVAPQVPIP